MSFTNKINVVLNTGMIVATMGGIAILSSGCSQRLGAMAEVEYDASVNPYHIVRRNETLSTIARDYGLDKRELARLNGLKPPFRIVVGQKLVVKKKTSGEAHSIQDPYDMPAAEGPIQTAGGVSVNALAPLPGTQEESAQNMGAQPFGNPMDSSNGFGGEGQESSEDMPKEQPKPVQTLPGIPQAASFYTWPVKGGNVVKKFSAKKGDNPGHRGLKIAAPQGTPVLATNNGVVARTQQVRLYGKTVLIKHDNGVISLYSHLDNINVKRGDVVQAGQKIGTVGKTGNAQEPQLYFEIHKSGKNGGRAPVDPMELLD